MDAGADLVKVYTRVDRTQIGPLLDEARTFNLPVAGHLGLTDAVTAARAGLTSLEHMSGIPEAVLEDPAPLFAAHERSFLAGWTASGTCFADSSRSAFTATARCRGTS